MNVLKIIGWVVLISILFFVGNVFFGTCNTANKMIDNGQKVVYDQFKPEELLRKYEWFKDAAAGLDQKIATLHTYDSRFSNLKEAYGADSSKRSAWGKEDKEQWNIWQSEYLGLKASYNELAAQYNAAMVKFNYRFCNVGDLPAGATEVLPREYKPYITN